MNRCEVCNGDGGEPFPIEFFGSQRYEASVCARCARKPRETARSIFKRIFGEP